jgi:aspartyl protease family protein
MMKRGRRRVRWLWMALLLLVPPMAAADLRVLGLFPGKALFAQDGAQFLLRDGETGPDGLRLLRATSRSALVEHQGRQQEWSLERGRFGGVYQAPAPAELRIHPDPQGGYVVQGSINGRSVRFMVDTGATLITVSEREAERLQLSLADAAAVSVQTASGQILGRRILLERVQLGALDERRVEAIVLPGEYPSIALLGMSFLSRLELRSEGTTLVLQTR